MNTRALIASPTRVLALSQEGELLLLDPLADSLQIVSRWPLTNDKVSVLSHPALVGSRFMFAWESGSSVSA